MENNEIQIVNQNNTALLETKDPTVIIEKANNVAKALAPIVLRTKLYNEIQGKKHVKVEGWTTMMAMIGVFPIVEYTKRLDRQNEIAYESRVILKTVSGAIVGSGEALCSSKEQNWSSRNEYAIKSMAQTRATGKAARISFSWIMAMAGFDTIPAEESHVESPESKAKEDVSKDVMVINPVGIKEFVSKKGTKFHRVMDDSGANYLIFDKKVLEIVQKAIETKGIIDAEVEKSKYGISILSAKIMEVVESA